MVSDWVAQRKTEWKPVTVAENAQNSGVVDLQYAFTHLAVSNIPDTTNSNWGISVSDDGTNFQSLYGWYLGVAADIEIPKQKSAVVSIGGFRYIRFDGDTGAEAAERTWKARGV